MSVTQNNRITEISDSRESGARDRSVEKRASSSPSARLQLAAAFRDVAGGADPKVAHARTRKFYRSRGLSSNCDQSDPGGNME